MPKYLYKNEVIVKIGNNVRKRRIRLGWTMMELSFEAGIDYRQLGRIERGEHNFTILSLVRITDALGCNLKDIVK